jgi:hypothetical protein
MRNALILLVALAATSLIGVQPSRAQFVACDSAYLRRFETAAEPGYPAWSPGELECVEYFRFSFSTPGGTRWIRGIGDVNVGTLLAPGAVAAVEDGARRSAQRMAALGNYRIDNTTLLLAFDVSRPSELSDDPAERREGGSAAWTTDREDPSGRECLVTLFLLGDYSPAGEIQYTTAHELFHCVQKATLSPEQNRTATGGGAWWAEGSAVWFSTAAIGSQARWNVPRVFAEAVRAERPLYDLNYEMGIFFYWYHQTRGIDQIMPFLSGMADNNGDAAQRAAMRDQLSDEGWLDFAEDYEDGNIVAPDGAPVPLSGVDGETWTISVTGTQRRTPAPFVLTLGWADFRCGRWEADATDINDSVREESSREWGEWPGEIDARDRGSVRYRMVALNTGEESAQQELDSRRTASCTPCLVESVIDRCLVGTWALTGGGPMEFLRRAGVPITRDNVGQLTITLNEDGSYQTRNVGIDYQVDPGSPIGPVDTRGQVQASFGRWSAEDGRLQACADGGGGAAATHTVRGRVIPQSMPSIAGTEGGAQYTCSDTTLTTMPDPRMPYTFTRQTPRRR